MTEPHRLEYFYQVSQGQSVSHRTDRSATVTWLIMCSLTLTQPWMMMEPMCQVIIFSSGAFYNSI